MRFLYTHTHTLGIDLIFSDLSTLINCSRSFLLSAQCIKKVSFSVPSDHMKAMRTCVRAVFIFKVPAVGLIHQAGYEQVDFINLSYEHLDKKFDLHETPVSSERTFVSYLFSNV